MNYATFDKSGRYTGSGHASPAALEGVDKSMMYLGQVDIHTHYHDHRTNKPAKMPDKPGNHHKFNYESRVWEKDDDAAWAAVKQRRHLLLAESDWVVHRSTEQGNQVPENWRSYRQALRDITQQADPHNIVWPALANPMTPS